MSKDTRLNLRMDNTNVKKLEKIAKAQGRTLSNLIRFILENFLKDQK